MGWVFYFELLLERLFKSKPDLQQFLGQDLGYCTPDLAQYRLLPYAKAWIGLKISAFHLAGAKVSYTRRRIRIEVVG